MTPAGPCRSRFDTRRIADRIHDVHVHEALTEHDVAFIGERDMFFLATADEHGNPTCSYKGGDPGFVRVVDDRTLAFPCYDGNGMFLSMGNVMANPAVGLLFLDLERGSRMRIQGVATVHFVDDLLADFPAAQLIVRVAIGSIFPNCPRYIHRYSMVERSSFVPRQGVTTPIPDWKRSEWARDALPADDPARGPSA